MDFSDFLYEHYFEVLGTLYLKFFFKSIFYPVAGRYLHIVRITSAVNCPILTLSTMNFFATGPPSPLKWPSKLEQNYARNAFNGPLLPNEKS